MLFYFGYRTFTEKPDQIIEKYGIQRVHHRILFFIAQVPGITVNDLLSILEVSKQALNAPLRLLSEKNLIKMVQADYDKRYKLLYLTQEGKQLESKLSHVQREQMKTIFDSLGSDHQKAWIDVMNALAKIRPGQQQFNAQINKQRN
ncbi:MarR family winged helix-turn-helix transcriptional regulator [Sporolactobacillus shoreicorticis]|uniref:MarR family winged helix-turn-helix transcriptional regulator n=1 Tax=Sporolactobacillus shoreicorticis TaxID=1923877 RepID=A0ABW5RZ97_9BACL|nr:MarR family winged helix-turn-helix transcriptional regulator [Sporolactobacillus shoreicorticis]MCO7128002.1 MarR family winged helix-turn-helix transcriptional regulator [Sporolactobacillus shoreicorticis]